jgi:hypothetical protein
MVYLVCLVVRIGNPTRRTREANTVFSQPVRFEAPQERGTKIYFLCFSAYKDKSAGGVYLPATITIKR